MRLSPSQVKGWGEYWASSCARSVTQHVARVRHGPSCHDCNSTRKFSLRTSQYLCLWTCREDRLHGPKLVRSARPACERAAGAEPGSARDLGGEPVQ